jgi:peptidylprolyl isomerase
MKMSRAGISIIVAGLMAMAGCGGSAGSATDSGGSAGTTTHEYTRTGAEFAENPHEAAHAADWGALKRYAGRYVGRLAIPDGPHPVRVEIRDLKVGKGPVIQPHDAFAAHYVSFTYTDGKVFENAWRGPTGTLLYEIEDLVDGWWPGLRGMRVGGVRELVVPSSWAYGDGALVYLVKLNAIERE